MRINHRLRDCVNWHGAGRLCSLPSSAAHNGNPQQLEGKV